MALKSIKDVVKMLNRFKIDQTKFLQDTSNNILTMLAEREGKTKDEMMDEIRLDIEILVKAITILEKESE